jgi:hypothetical protein
VQNDAVPVHIKFFLLSVSQFRAEKLVHAANNIAEGIVQVIAKHGTKNLVMRSAAERY